jgi:hypothetical protein
MNQMTAAPNEFKDAVYSDVKPVHQPNYAVTDPANPAPNNDTTGY